MDRTPGIRPRPTLWRRLDAAARHCFPATATVVGMILSAAPFGLPGQAQILPAWVLACVFFWSLFRPAAMSPPVVFLIGVLADLLGQMPLGVSVVVLLAAHGLALRVRRVLPRQGFLVVWLVFVAVAAGASALEWVLLSALSLRLLPPIAVVFQFGLTAGLYPILAAVFIRAHRGLAAPEQA